MVASPQLDVVHLVTVPEAGLVDEVVDGRPLLVVLALLLQEPLVEFLYAFDQVILVILEGSTLVYAPLINMI